MISITKTDPLKLSRVMWPSTEYYRKQLDIMYSVEENVETFVYSANKMGKDFIASRIILLSVVRCHLAGMTWRIVTTSGTKRHLDVLWGEIDSAIRMSALPLRHNRGGFLVCNTCQIQPVINGEINELCYVQGLVVTNENKGEGLSGHHADFTLFVGDEASSLRTIAYEMAQGWAKRFLIFGNCNECQNFYRKAWDIGDIAA